MIVLRATVSGAFMPCCPVELLACQLILAQATVYIVFLFFFEQVDVDVDGDVKPAYLRI